MEIKLQVGKRYWIQEFFSRSNGIFLYSIGNFFYFDCGKNGISDICCFNLYSKEVCFGPEIVGKSSLELYLDSFNV